MARPVYLLYRTTKRLKLKQMENTVQKSQGTRIAAYLRAQYFTLYLTGVDLFYILFK